MEKKQKERNQFKFLFPHGEKKTRGEQGTNKEKKKSTSVLSKSGSLYKLLKEETFRAAVVVRGR